MTPSQYDPKILISPCPYCNSDNVQEGGDDFDGDVACNTCTLITPIFHGTDRAIKAWNERKYVYTWSFLNSDYARAYMIMI